MKILNKNDLDSLIENEVEESIQIEYKSSGALENTPGKKKEISKDVSAMANSAGGIIIYGIKEYDDEDKKHLPEQISPVLRTQYSKEWLEQVINSNIQPTISGIIITPIIALTTDATITIMHEDILSSDLLTLPANTIWSFECHISAIQQTGSVGGSWLVKGLIRRDGSNNTTLDWSNVTIEYDGWTTAVVSVSANDTLDTLEISVTGIASTAIRWVGTLQMTQISYA